MGDADITVSDSGFCRRRGPFQKFWDHIGRYHQQWDKRHPFEPGGISGRVSFGVGNDLVDNTSGRIESQIYPGGGNDRCIGDHDAGKMTGDSGADRFDFNGFDEVLPMVGTTNHLITDFATIDARGL